MMPRPPAPAALWFKNQADIILAFNYTSRYPNDLLNVDNINFQKMID